MYCFFKKGIRTREWEEIFEITQLYQSFMLIKKQRPRKQKGQNRTDLTPTWYWVINVIIAFKNIEQNNRSQQVEARVLGNRKRCEKNIYVYMHNPWTQ